MKLSSLELFYPKIISEILLVSNILKTFLWRFILKGKICERRNSYLQRFVRGFIIRVFTVREMIALTSKRVDKIPKMVNNSRLRIISIHRGGPTEGSSHNVFFRYKTLSFFAGEIFYINFRLKYKNINSLSPRTHTQC